MKEKITESGKEKERIETLRCTEFLKDAKRLLQDKEISSEYGCYILNPSDGQYPKFLNFLIEEMENLPFENQIGESILMRPDARAVTEKLVKYLKKQLHLIKEKKQWNEESICDIADIFKGGFGSLEVFKNEIYPDMNQSGICYSLDLGARSDTKENYKPTNINLHRYFVNKKTEIQDFSIRADGEINLLLRNGGTIAIYLDDSMLTGSHIHKRL